MELVCFCITSVSFAGKILKVDIDYHFKFVGSIKRNGLTILRAFEGLRKLVRECGWSCFAVEPWGKKPKRSILLNVFFFFFLIPSHKLPAPIPRIDHWLQIQRFWKSEENLSKKKKQKPFLRHRLCKCMCTYRTVSILHEQNDMFPMFSMWFPSKSLQQNVTTHTHTRTKRIN